MNINKVCVVTEQGASCHQVGKYSGDKIVKQIVSDVIRINGDLFEHFIGLDDEENIIFTIDKRIYCEVIYE